MQSFSLPKVLIIAAIAVALAGVGMYVFKKNLPGEVIPILTNDELAAAGLYVELYENPRTGFTMNTPVGWTLDESGALGAFVVFVSPTPDLQGSISFSPSITIIGEEANYLEDYVRKTKAAIPLTLEDFRVTENRKVSLGGTEGHLIGGTFTYSGLPLQTIRLLVYADNRGYAITGTSLAETWHKDQHTIVRSLLSFRPASPEL